MHKMSRRFVAAVAAGAAVFLSAGAAYAATITTPSSSPFAVPGDSNGNPLPFTVVATGFQAGQPVFAEQCDGLPPTAQGWDVTIDCDNGASNAPVLADATGKATFTAPGTREFDPVKGLQPTGGFACLAPNDPPLSPLPPGGDWTNCQLRISSNNTTATSDQAFITLTMPNAPVATTTTTTTVPTSTTLGSCSGIQFLGTLTPPLPGDGSVATGIVASLKTAKTGLVVWGPGFGGSITTTGAATCGFPNGVHPDATISAKLSGNATCNSASLDPTQYPLNGKLKISYAAKALSEQAYVRVAGFDPVPGPDVIALTGMDVKGSIPGATVSGEVFFDPVIKALATGEAGGPELKGQYYFDNNQIVHACGTAGGGSIGLIYGGDGTSLLGSAASGLSFSF